MAWLTRSLVVVLLLAALAACGDDDDDVPQTQPAPDVTTFVGGSISDLPLPPLAEPLGPVREVEGGVLVRSFGVRNTTPERVMAFYLDVLDGVPVIEAPGPAPGAGNVLRGRWQLEDAELHVTAQPAPTVEGETPTEEPTVQLSLEVHPERGG